MPETPNALPCAASRTSPFHPSSLFPLLCLRPSVIMGTAGREQMLNYELAAFIDAGAFYTASYNGNTTHTGPTLTQFAVGTRGLLRL